MSQDVRSEAPSKQKCKFCKFFGIKTCKHYQKKQNVKLEQILDLTQEKW